MRKLYINEGEAHTNEFLLGDVKKKPTFLDGTNREKRK